ncbi:MAG: hypothetical protein ACFFA8_06180 [Promethearchaeota archaeon]
MFNVLEGGVSEPINWSMDNLTPDRSIIILDETNQVVWLWYGSKQGLVARRTALRQAESLKGHGYQVGKSIIGRDIKYIKEIDQRKIGRESITDALNKDLQELLNREYNELDNYVVTFELKETIKPAIKPIVKEEPKSEPIVQTEPTFKPEPKSTVKVEPKPIIKPEPTPVVKLEPTPSKVKVIAPQLEKVQETDLKTEAKIAFVLMGILDHYDDIWVSKKDDGTYAVEMMDGPICQFSIKEGAKISFSADSFKGISTNIKSEIQKKFVELSKLI